MLVLGLEHKKTIDKALNGIGAGIARYQQKEHLNDVDMDRILGCSISTYRKIKDGESVKRSTEEVLWMMMLAGMWR